MAETPYGLWREGGDTAAPFVVCAMSTPDYRLRAERLAASLDRFGLTHALFEVPQVHHSISVRGGEDIVFSKPRFIAAMLARFGKPVLYLDSDVVVRDPPALVDRLCREDCDFAIYNWLADPMNDAWAPEPDTPLWKFSFRIEVASDSQLMASGAVQFWQGTRAAFALLSDWEKLLLESPRSADDECLDFVFNHNDRANMRTRWLPKPYCRIAYWPYVAPVIDHPQFPVPSKEQFHSLGTHRFRRDRLRRSAKEEAFPQDAVVDTASKRLLRQTGNGFYADIGPLPCPIFLPIS